VLEGGKIVERGSHEELLAARGRYFELYETQFATGNGSPAEVAGISEVEEVSTVPAEAEVA
jgi:ATP-binding cassette subfamily B protein